MVMEGGKGCRLTSKTANVRNTQIPSARWAAFELPSVLTHIMSSHQGRAGRRALLFELLSSLVLVRYGKSVSEHRIIFSSSMPGFFHWLLRKRL